MAYIQIVVGLVLLIFAGDILVRGAVSIAQRAGISKLVIGLTVVAFGTSAPELVVGIDAILENVPTLALGNIVGSNIANILLVLGVPALIAPMACNAPRLGRNLAIMLGATCLFIGLAYTQVFGFWQGAVLFSFLVAFLVYSGMRAKTATGGMEEMEKMEELNEAPNGYGLAAVLIIGGLLGLMIGADMLVTGSVYVARHQFHVSEAVIGLTLVAIGTSLPELATALMASARGHCDVAVGNVIGSNLFNLLGIMGVTAMIGTVPVPESFLRVDLWVMLASSMLLIPFCRYRANVGRFAGIVLLGLYTSYMYYLSQSPESANVMGMHFEQPAS
ncbi:MAG: calcium/sodium antiporter [Kordiimonadaceae bacterium]|nr:calcium/sodium antiporter [Kordiimonadaceae bacterium]